METQRTTIPQAEEILGLYFPVLDHGFISLVDYMGSDQSIEQAARVSYGGGTRKTSETKGLLRYLKRHLHTTPTEMVELKFHVCCPIFVMRQWIRHRMSSTNEYSGRYSLMPMVFYTPESNRFQKQSQTNKQGSSDEVVSNADDYITRLQNLREQTESLYHDMTENEVAREIARIDLPLSTYTQFYWKIDLHNLMHFLKLRVDSHAQLEIQEYGKVMAGMFKRVAPLTYEAWLDYDVGGCKLSLAERLILKNILRTSVGENGKLIIDTKAIAQEISPTESFNKREVVEFVDKFTNVNAVDFELDLSKAKSAEFFAEKMAAATK